MLTLGETSTTSVNSGSVIYVDDLDIIPGSVLQVNFLNGTQEFHIFFKNISGEFSKIISNSLLNSSTVESEYLRDELVVFLSPKQCTTSNTNVALIGGCVGGAAAFLILLIGAIYFCIYRHNEQQKEKMFSGDSYIRLESTPQKY